MGRGTVTGPWHVPCLWLSVLMLAKTLCLYVVMLTLGVYGILTPPPPHPLDTGCV